MVKDAEHPKVVRDFLRHTLFNVTFITCIVVILSVSAAVTCLPLRPPTSRQPLRSFVAASIRWSAAQILRSVVPAEIDEAWRTADAWEAEAWMDWESGVGRGNDGTDRTTKTRTVAMEVPVLDLTSCHQFGGGSTPPLMPCRPTASDVAKLLGRDFRSRPLLLRGLWDQATLLSSSRRLSIRGMANHTDLANLTVPYYADSSKSGYSALKPSGTAPLHEIVYNVTELGGMQKIGSQIIVETNPELIDEVVPRDVVTELFGNYFKPDDVRGSGPWRLLPARTTVPVFFAASREDQAPTNECM